MPRNAPARRSFAAALPLLSTVYALVSAAPMVAQVHDHGPGQGDVVGTVTFPVSCAAAVASDFERAAAMLHSFWFAEAATLFGRIAAADPGCAMAHWGLAMTEMGNPMTRALPPAEGLRAGFAASVRARELSASQTHREQMYAASVIAYFQGEGRDFTDRITAHEQALAELYAAHPEDPEAAIFYGRAIVANAPPTDLAFTRQLAAAELMEPLFARLPDHPGVAHYLIHAYDAPPLAQRATEAAFAYAEIAPSAPHALHMPSHIFTRLGYWHESIEVNARSAAAEPVPDAAVHPMDYLVYAHLQLGRNAEAGEVVARAVQNDDRYYAGTLGYNFAAMPARYALEREAWAEAASLRIPTGASASVEAITHFARAIGAARSGAPEAAGPAVEALARLETALRTGNDAYWATVVGAQRLAAAAWVARARGETDTALRLATEAADLEETVEKHPVTPGPLLPARELLGDLLLELGRPVEALAAYEATLLREPNRARTLFGAARAAEAVGRLDTARTRYAELLELMAGADPDRPEPIAARAFLARH